jgi:TolB-like protein/Tfp pilus assembly protein PilF
MQFREEDPQVGTGALDSSAETSREGSRRLLWKWKWGVAGIVAAAVLALSLVSGLAKSFWPTGEKTRAMSLAVLPLENRSPDQQPDYFVDGVTEALTTDLASLPSIRVVARQSVTRYRSSQKAASDIARELKADALLEGAVQRSGQRVRVDIRLIDGATGRSVWATTHERDLVDALTLQADISRAIVGELHVTLDPTHGKRLANRRPSNSEAWDAYLRARFFWNKRTHEDMGHAIEWYERAIQKDPASPLVYAGLADVYATLGPPKTAIGDLIARGTAAADKAIALDPLMGEPYAALGKLRAYAWDWQGAETNYRKAVELAPAYAPARYWFASFLANQGRCREAFVEAREGERLDPVSVPGNQVVAGVELKCGRVEQAINRIRMTLEFDSTFAQAYELLGRAYLRQARADDAIAMIQRALELNGGRATTHAALGFAYAMAGRRQEAKSIGVDLAERHSRDKVLASAWSVAIVYAGLDDPNATLTWLEHAFDDHEEWLEALPTDERFLRFHALERFQRLLGRLGLPSGLSPN